MLHASINHNWFFHNVIIIVIWSKRRYSLHYGIRSCSPCSITYYVRGRVHLIYLNRGFVTTIIILWFGKSATAFAHSSTPQLHARLARNTGLLCVLKNRWVCCVRAPAHYVAGLYADYGHTFNRPTIGTPRRWSFKQCVGCRSSCLIK